MSTETEEQNSNMIVRLIKTIYLQIERSISSGISNILGPISYKRQRQFKSFAFYFSLAIALIVIIFPLFWAFSSALRPDSEIFSSQAPLLPNTWTLTQFTSLLAETDFLTYYINSILYSAGVVIVTVVCATLGGYGLTRLEIPYKTTFARVILFGYMFPSILLAIPMFIFWREIGLVNSYIGLVLAETAVALPFSLWLMWKFFQTVPYSLEESAQMDGASRFRAFYEIALPIAKPGMVAVAVFAYAISWNEFTLPLVIMQDSSGWPLTIGVFTLTQQNQVLWGQIMAASTLAILPSLIFIYFLQKHLLRGFRT